MYKIEAIVMTNGYEAFVLSECPKITYERYGDHLLGLDEQGVFANSYQYRRPSDTWRAFGGRKFNIPMVDGSVIKAHGQWWDGGNLAFTDALGCEIITVTARDIISLRKCYVFSGLRAVAAELAILRKTYTGKVYEYWEYDCMLNGKSVPWARDPKNPKKHR